MFFNKLILFLILIGTAGKALAVPCIPVKWNVEGQQSEICYDEKAEAMISVACVTKPCGVREFAKKVVGLHLKRDAFEATQNPGSIYCRFFKGRVVMGRNERKSQNAFCQAGDGSLIDLSALAEK